VTGAGGSAPAVTGAGGSAPAVTGAGGSAPAVTGAGGSAPAVLLDFAARVAALRCTVPGPRRWLDDPRLAGFAQSLPNH
jgi:hypothetical protein